jgi:hypothetical protein
LLCRLAAGATKADLAFVGKRRGIPHSADYVRNDVVVGGLFGEAKILETKRDD